MNGYMLLTQSAALIGMEKIGDKLKIIGLPMVNSVMEEVGLLPLSSLSEVIGAISQGQKNALLYGLASRIAAAFGDETAKADMTLLYRRKLSSLRGRVCRVKEAMPRGEEI